jgi:hypothetical protein
MPIGRGFWLIRLGGMLRLKSKQHNLAKRRMVEVKIVKKRPSFKEFKKSLLQDDAFKAEYEKLHAEFELIKQFIKAQKKHRMKKTAVLFFVISLSYSMRLKNLLLLA